MNKTPLYYRCEGTATEVFSELRANKKYAEILEKMGFVDDNGHPLALCEDFVDMCERWQKLEAAVAWHGLDELPKVGKKIELKAANGDIDIEFIESLYDWKSNSKYYVGWRYRVGDLSE